MSERKVLNKYYPPDFDPSKIPKLKLPKDRQYVVRLMAPFNMRCKTCGEYIYKGKKFNARKETVQNEVYLGLPIFRFYIKCTRCLAEITFKTDPENTDYTMEHGATRNFQAEKLLEEEEKRVQKEREDEELNNPMKVLENRTKDSKLEMEVLENLQELKDLNQRQAHVDFEAMLRQHRLSEEERQQQEQEEDERETAVSSGVLVSSCCCNRNARSGELSRTDICFLTVLEAGSRNQNLSQADSFWELLSWFLVSVAILAPVFPLLCLCVCSALCLTGE
ncbi:splicing factor YJU2 isoform X4 [Loxodonta africana]|uniref:splicing factor YJU2 isoform X4 n=1 Tax=Loxodonta africana TaxID=9785 RepID=UPI000C811725|nr:coiled-coil domain-containing protein 94 isoform X2 [Loxodonta africana]